MPYSRSPAECRQILSENQATMATNIIGNRTMLQTVSRVKSKVYGINTFFKLKRNGDLNTIT